MHFQSNTLRLKRMLLLRFASVTHSPERNEFDDLLKVEAIGWDWDD